MWIKIKDRLPEDNQLIIVCFTTNATDFRYDIGYIIKDKDREGNNTVDYYFISEVFAPAPITVFGQQLLCWKKIDEPAINIDETLSEEGRKWFMSWKEMDDRAKDLLGRSFIQKYAKKFYSELSILE